jgi:dipeptidyl aminopeptidase/acylaminoacyl peptidase
MIRSDWIRSIWFRCIWIRRTWIHRTSALLFLIISALAFGTAHAQSKRPMQFEDMMKMRRLGDIAVSPDGHWVLYSATDVDLAKNTRTSHLWIIPTSGGDARALTASSAGESRGRFSPDGKRILFQSAREGSQQIYLASFDSAAGTIGEPHHFTSISTEADGAMWSPDGQNTLFTSAVYPDCADDACNKQRDDAAAASKVKARIFTALLYRHWNAYTGDKRSHLFLVPAAGGTPRDLTPGDTHDVPPFSLGGPDAYAFSPDSKELAFEENLDKVPAISTNADIFTLDLTNPGAKPVKISTSPGGDFSPAYSPDGKYLAWRSQARAGYESDRFRLVLYDRATKQIKELLPNFDRWVDEFVWAPDSKMIYFTAGSWGEEPVFSIDLNGNKPSSLTQSSYEGPTNFIGQDDFGEYSDLHVDASGRLMVLTRITVRSPAEVYALLLKDYYPADSVPDDSKTGQRGQRHESAQYRATHGAMIDATETLVTQQRLTHLNDALLSELDLPAMESFWFPSIGKVRVQGFLIKPPAFDAGKKYPVKFLIHGGPQGAWGDAWSYRWNAELFAASGYVVVMINPRGSTGYGQAFTDGVNGDWGGKPFIDLMRGLDYAEAHYPFIDKSRECALGASYGGYMANWVLGHTTRFKCIVSHDGMFNPEAAYGATEELWFNEWEFKGKPWDYYGKSTAANPYRKWSPALSAKSFKTPTLVVHSQLDYRLDVSQGFDLFTALQRLDVPSKMLYFPDEGHWVLKPQNSQLWYKTVGDWVDQWTKTP